MPQRQRPEFLIEDRELEFNATNGTKFSALEEDMIDYEDPQPYEGYTKPYQPSQEFIETDEELDQAHQMYEAEVAASNNSHQYLID